MSEPGTATASGFVSVEEARSRSGLRLVLTVGVPGPWGEAAKGLFHAKGIPFARVPQAGGQDNVELVEWTGIDNAPQAILNDEAPRCGWAEIVLMAERMSPKPALVPDEPGDRALMFGLCHELMGEGGLCWTRRLMMLHPLMQLPEDNPVRAIGARLAGKYGYDATAAEAAPDRAARILEMLGDRLRAQRDKDRPGFVGESITAADILWAAAAALVDPLPDEVCAMPDFLRAQYGTPDPRIAEALDPALLDHRDRVYREFMEYPLVLS